MFTKKIYLLDGSVEEWKTTITTNVLSLSICTKEALKSMRKKGDNGHIVHINRFYFCIGNKSDIKRRILFYFKYEFLVLQDT